MHMPLKAVLWGHRRRFIPNPSKGSSHSWFQAVRRPFPAVSGFAHAGRGWNASNPAAAIRQSFRPAFPPLRNQQGRPEGERGGTTRPPPRGTRGGMPSLPARHTAPPFPACFPGDTYENAGESPDGIRRRRRTAYHHHAGMIAMPRIGVSHLTPMRPVCNRGFP